ncbi:MAG: hypothetical protein ACPG7F_02690 [Aggregatilineales bacterium]
MYRKISILVFFLLIIPTFAQTDNETEIDLTVPVNAGYGLTFMLPEDWTESVDEEFDIRVQHPEDDTAYIRFRFVGENELAYVDFTASEKPLVDALIEMYLADLQPPVYEDSDDGTPISVIERYVENNRLTLAGYDAAIYLHNSVSGDSLDVIALYIPEHNVVAVLEGEDAALLMQVAETLEVSLYPPYMIDTPDDLLSGYARDYLYIDTEESSVTIIWYPLAVLERRNVPDTLEAVLQYEYEAFWQVDGMDNFDADAIVTMEIDETAVHVYQAIDPEGYESRLHVFRHSNGTIFVAAVIPFISNVINASDNARLLTLALSIEENTPDE